MLSEPVIDGVLRTVPSLTIGVVGDLFLDRYLDLDGALTEPSLETGLDAYQVVRVRSSPGAAGTVINNLAALGVGRIVPVAVIGDDGEGYELHQSLDALGVVTGNWLIATRSRRTPTYTKPMLCPTGSEPRELNRLDIKNRSVLERVLEDEVLKGLEDVWQRSDALVVLDQVSERDCGVITSRVRQRLAQLGESDPGKFVLADSRERIGLFRNVHLKPNGRECRQALGHSDGQPPDAGLLARLANRAVFCTCGEKGILVAEPSDSEPRRVPAYRVSGPTDIVGAGDSTSAAIVCARASGMNLLQSAAFGNLVASVTIQQLGTTGTASPVQVRERWRAID
jgi:rfaE bifunctional protein kinase chain/domain